MIVSWLPSSAEWIMIWPLRFRHRDQRAVRAYRRLDAGLPVLAEADRLAGRGDVLDRDGAVGGNGDEPLADFDRRQNSRDGGCRLVNVAATVKFGGALRHEVGLYGDKLDRLPFHVDDDETLSVRRKHRRAAIRNRAAPGKASRRIEASSLVPLASWPRMRLPSLLIEKGRTNPPPSVGDGNSRTQLEPGVVTSVLRIVAERDQLACPAHAAAPDLDRAVFGARREQARPWLPGSARRPRSRRSPPRAGRCRECRFPGWRRRSAGTRRWRRHCLRRRRRSPCRCRAGRRRRASSMPNISPTSSGRSEPRKSRNSDSLKRAGPLGPVGSTGTASLLKVSPLELFVGRLDLLLLLAAVVAEGASWFGRVQQIVVGKLKLLPRRNSAADDGRSVVGLDRGEQSALDVEQLVRLIGVKPPIDLVRDRIDAILIDGTSGRAQQRMEGLTGARWILRPSPRCRANGWCFVDRAVGGHLLGAACTGADIQCAPSAGDHCSAVTSSAVPSAKQAAVVDRSASAQATSAAQRPRRSGSPADAAGQHQPRQQRSQPRRQPRR